jgi:carboxyl-terminal processing protease
MLYGGRVIHMFRGRFPLAVALVPLCAAGAAQSPTADAPKPDPIAYLNRALDEMQARALRRGTVDWPHVRAEALARAAHANTAADTYDAIRFALASLGDHHSSFHPAPAIARLESQRQPRQTVAPSSPFIGRYEPDGRLATLGGGIFAIVVVTKCFPENDRQFVAYETKLQGLVADLDRSHPSGWVVDLRGNVGGNMWPMLTGIGPLLGEGDRLGEFFNTGGHSVWRYRDGVASEVGDDGKADPYPPVAGSPYKVVGTPHVAVLIDGGTGSSGEAVAIALRGRPNTRFFGEHTQGASTVNEVFALSDGAAMWLTIGVDADRTGKQYIDGFAPDEAIRGGDKALPDAQDPVLQAALRWLSALLRNQTKPPATSH